MLLELENAIDEGDLESVTYNIYSHRLSEEDVGFGVRDFEPIPRLEAAQVGGEALTGPPRGCVLSVSFEANVNSLEYFGGYVGSGLFNSGSNAIFPIEVSGVLVWRLKNKTLGPGFPTIDIPTDPSTFFDNWHQFFMSIVWDPDVDNWVVTYRVDDTEETSNWPVTGAPYDAGGYQVPYRSPDPFANVCFGACYNTGGCTGPVDRTLRAITYTWNEGTTFQFPPDVFDDFDAGRVTFTGGELHAFHSSCFARAFYETLDPGLDSIECCMFMWGQKATISISGVGLTGVSCLYDCNDCVDDTCYTFVDVDDHINSTHELFLFDGFGGDLTFSDGPWCIWQKGAGHEGGYINGHKCDDPDIINSFSTAFIIGHDRLTGTWYLFVLTLFEEGGTNCLLIFAGTTDNLADGFDNELAPGLIGPGGDWFSVFGGFLQFALDGSDLFPYSSCTLQAIGTGGSATAFFSPE